MNNLHKALNNWNRHTNPAICRSDYEHFIHRKAARKIMKLIKQDFTEGYHYVESDYSGRLLALTH